MYRTTLNLLAGAIALGLTAGAAGAAETADTGKDSTTLGAVLVTGSNIKRSDTAGPNPVQIVSREQIEQTGRSTLTDVLRNLSANAGNSFDEQYTGSFAAGSASIGLRGLSPKNTLVLVNGYRVSNFGFALNTQDTFVDLNALPISAVERIEVLKDGASAVYGRRHRRRHQHHPAQELPGRGSRRRLRYRHPGRPERAQGQPAGWLR
jgi:iron complex outermembrane receptor protein